MSKKDLIDAVSQKCDLTKEKATEVVDATLSHIKTTLNGGGEVRLPDFGSFKITDRKAREGRNPLTGKTIQIKASRAPKFTAAKGFKDLLNPS